MHSLDRLNSPFWSYFDFSTVIILSNVCSFFGFHVVPSYVHDLKMEVMLGKERRGNIPLLKLSEGFAVLRTNYGNNVIISHYNF